MARINDPELLTVLPYLPTVEILLFYPALFAVLGKELNAYTDGQVFLPQLYAQLYPYTLYMFFFSFSCLYFVMVKTKFRLTYITQL